ncbi:MAG TPA: hypothetical protein VK141_08310 [Nitrosomonas sp.]|nr:hypothetical protein [Nitrosomonas sp.]
MSDEVQAGQAEVGKTSDMPNLNGYHKIADDQTQFLRITDQLHPRKHTGSMEARPLSIK